jgi:hypothetical protein
MAEQRGYESRDVNSRAVWLSALALIVMLAVALTAAGWLQGVFGRQQPALSQQTHITLIPPGPRLQAQPQADLQALRAAEDAILGSYGWVDKENRIVRIPIERAMQLVVQQGLSFRRENGRAEQ